MPGAVRNSRMIKTFTEVRFPIFFFFFEHEWDTNFFLFLGILHVSYAPEYESIDDIRKKFEQRRDEVKRRINLNKKS